jgi:hypothetical protein
MPRTARRVVRLIQWLLELPGPHSPPWINRSIVPRTVPAERCLPIIEQFAPESARFRDALKADRRIVQKAEIVVVPTRDRDIARLLDADLTLLPDCGTPRTRITVCAFAMECIC